MNDTKKLFSILNIITVVLLLTVTVCGVLSFNTTHTFETINQYSDTVKMWGYGIYKFDSFFKAPLFIGTDLAILILSGISLFVAWLPDIITSLAKGRSLELIEVYTTEVTYVLDMGIISPVMFIAFFLVRKDSFVGYVLLRMILKVGKYLGIILPMQTFFQLLAGIDLPVPALITKVGIFVALAAFATYFERKIKKDTQYIAQLQV